MSRRRSFDAIEKQLGVVLNMMRTMVQSPRVLEGYLALSGALSRGLLPAALQFALPVLQRRGGVSDELSHVRPGCTFLGRGNRGDHRARRVERVHELLQSSC